MLLADAAVRDARHLRACPGSRSVGPLYVLLVVVSATAPVPALVKPTAPPLSTICEAIVKVPVLFCWMPSVPPPSGPVSDPPLIV